MPVLAGNVSQWDVQFYPGPTEDPVLYADYTDWCVATAFLVRKHVFCLACVLPAPLPSQQRCTALLPVLPLFALARVVRGSVWVELTPPPLPCAC